LKFSMDSYMIFWQGERSQETDRRCVSLIATFQSTECLKQEDTLS